MRGTLGVCLCAWVVVCPRASLWAQEPEGDVELPSVGVLVDGEPETPGIGEAPLGEVSIEEVLKTTVYVTSKKPTLVRESPGVVTVVTREEIINSGARDLVDVLSLVPGFSFGVDVQGVVSVGFRGNWGTEGKVLLLVDGQEMNELLYSGFQLGNHLPVEHIERIEVIRGPGSAIYGGFAELAVVNITTRGGARLEGVAVAGYYGHLRSTYARRNLSVEGGQRSGKLAFSLSAQIGQGVRSDELYTDVGGDSYQVEDNAQLDPIFINAAVDYEGLRARLLFDDFRMTQRDGFGENSERPDDQVFRTMIADVQYDWQINDDVLVTPRLNFKQQTPWQTSDQMSGYFYDKTVIRALANVTSSIDLRKNLNLLAGGELFYDHAVLNAPPTEEGLQTFFGTANEVDYQNVAGFAQLTLSHRVANVTAGARYEYHSQFGGSFVPRLGLTKVAGRFHVKLLAASAFRAPGIENINLNADVQPERTLVFEVETGYQLTDNVFFSLNAFDTTIEDAIVYTIVDDQEGYFNSEQAGTRGVEYELKMRYSWGYVNASTSFYTARGKNEVPNYAVPGHEDHLLAFPLFKIAVNSSFRLYRGLTLNPSGTWLSERYGFGQADADGNLLLEHASSAALFNVFLNYADLGVDGLEVGAGCYDLLDERFAYIQPYDGGHPPLPGPGRELVARVAYTLPF